MVKIKPVKHTKEDGFFRSAFTFVAIACFFGGGVMIYNGEYQSGFGCICISALFFWIIDKIPQKNVWKD